MYQYDEHDDRTAAAQTAASQALRSALQPVRVRQPIPGEIWFRHGGIYLAAISSVHLAGRGMVVAYRQRRRDSEKEVAKVMSLDDFVKTWQRAGTEPSTNLLPEMEPVIQPPEYVRTIEPPVSPLPADPKPRGRRRAIPLDEQRENFVKVNLRNWERRHASLGDRITHDPHSGVPEYEDLLGMLFDKGVREL